MQALRLSPCERYTGSSSSSIPRSSNGRTAAFGAVNRGSNPCRGATAFLHQLEAPMLLTAAPGASLARIRHIPEVLVRRAFSPVGREASCGSKLNPRVEAGPHV